MAAEVPFLAATHKAFPRIFARQNAQAAPSASLWLTNICVQICLVLIWLTGSDYNTLLTIASEMILVPYFLVGAFLLKIATRPLHKAVGVGACIYGFMVTVRLWSQCTCCYPLFCMHRGCWFSCMRAKRIHMIMY
ncbi:arginine/ornithine antiporter [Escherichia coli]|uniref:Arginine/ornithine antiporter n=1 Tax=Escherichia coli TaxID=562 RepID=A0A376TFC8_ECOLX|nr:arginine/ornithine antiporter [Escherichia coli]